MVSQSASEQSDTNFGFAGHIRDKHPFALFPQSDFAKLSQDDNEPKVEGDRKIYDERTKVVVLKAILERGGRKWQFVWNGIKISAPIRSDTFFDKMASKEYEFGQGDILDVTLRITRAKDEMAGVFINEKYEIIEVHSLEKTPRQTGLLP